MQKKANKNATDDTGMTPLHWATSNQNTECVEFLLNQEADTGLRDFVGIKTSLIFCSSNATSYCILFRKSKNYSITS